VNNDSCARPACKGKPVAWLAYDYEARCAWIDDQPTATSDPSHLWPLCERHADNLRVPRGWFSVDRRASRGAPEVPAPESERPPGTPEPAASAVDAQEGSPGSPSGGPAQAGGRLSAIL
jgi:hypothetical protein